jgi:hypothetical protein
MRTSILHCTALGILVAAAASCSSSSGGTKPPMGNVVPETSVPAETLPHEDLGQKTGGPLSPDESNVTHEPLLIGRFETSDPAGPKASWPGTRIIARFDGTAVSVKLSEFAEPWMDGAPSYWEVSIDKGEWRPIAMIADNQPRDFELAKDLPPLGPHEVELYKRSETQTGITQFLGFDFHGGRSLPSPEHKQRKIEVLGDSQASGYGIEMLDAPNLDCPGADHSGIYQNFRKAWSAQLGTMLDAEVHGIVYSGKGIEKNLWKADTDPLEDYYHRTNPNPAKAHDTQLYDFNLWVPDVIVMTQGSCDFAGGLSDDEFRTVYRNFVMNQLRPRAPNAHIFMGVLGKGGRGTIEDVGQQLISERAASGDNRLHVFTAPLYTGEEMTACTNHGNPGWHARIATQIAGEIKSVMGW